MVLGTIAWVSFPGARSVSAAEVLVRLNQAAQGPTPFGLRSFEGVFIQDATGPGTETADTAHTENHIWYQAPDKERIEIRTKSNKLMISVNDGKTRWLYDPSGQQVTLYDSTFYWIDFASIGEGDLQSLLTNTDAGYDAQLLDSEQVAGRTTYVLQLTPKVETSISLPHKPNRKRLWVDQETYMILRYEEDDDDFNLDRTWTYTSFTANPEISPDLLSFSPPAGTSVIDMLDESGPTGRLVREQWEQMATRVNFPLFRFATLFDSFVIVEGPVQDSNNPNKVVQRLRWLPDEEDTLTLIEEPGPLPDASTLGEPTVIGDFVGYLKRDGDIKWLTWEEEGTVITLLGRRGVAVEVLMDFPQMLERVRVR
ncbi:MAG: outer membrane lipoprotein-sorting protein [Chloroflexota bacterium]|nr:outer membrane lipoprotein-sorting protein [Chloroflexota bacterium]